MYSLILVIIFLWILTPALLRFLKIKKALQILSEGKPAVFLKMIQPIIDKTRKKRLVDMYSINKAVGLFYNGQFTEAIDLMNQIDLGNIPPTRRLVYYKNLLDYYLHSDRLEEAKKFYEANKATFIVRPDTPLYNNAFEITLAFYELKLGDPTQGKMLLEQLEAKELKMVTKALVKYNLGLIALKEGQAEKAHAYFLNAKAFTGETFLREKVDQELSMLGRQIS